MKAFLPWLFTLACATRTPPPPEPARPAASPASETVDVDAARARSHAFFEALDRADKKAVDAAILPSFVMFQEARYYDAKLVDELLQSRIDKQAGAHTREWDDEHVFGAGNTVVYTGHAIESIPGAADRPAHKLDGYWTLVWTHDATRWRAVFAEWDRGGIDAERERWNEWLVTATFNRKPNRLLVDSVKDRKPGTALDIASGQGRNAVFLAKAGWQVTAVDIADQGLRITREEAARQQTKVDTVQADIDSWDLGTNRWDLVTMIYAGADAKLVERIKPALKKGGLFVTEYFSKESDLAASGAGGWGTGELAALFKTGYKILRDEVVEDNADWAGQRKTKLVRFVAQKL